ncbi:MAG: hypothetical protein M1824_004784 [Vezdaea acicularis]|nr:MAG: hypothetical protein M1824_004784 [Vezdaea acicularis]
MSSAGPELPPHLIAKRKRKAEEEAEQRRQNDRTNSRSSDKRQRVVGPTLPPAPLEGLPLETPSEDGGSSSSDSDIGPALPSAIGQKAVNEANDTAWTEPESSEAIQSAEKLQREEWMLVPPKQDDWSSRVDPTKLRNRKFNTGMGSKAPAARSRGESTVWTETPEQKRKRLEDEVMGVKRPAALGEMDEKPDRSAAEATETARRIQEYNDQNRNKSLYNEHKKTVPKEKEDDPSARPFDREKDIGGGRQIDHTQRKELLNKAAGFGSRFAGGKYL